MPKALLQKFRVLLVTRLCDLILFFCTNFVSVLAYFPFLSKNSFQKPDLFLQNSLTKNVTYAKCHLWLTMNHKCFCNGFSWAVSQLHTNFFFGGSAPDLPMRLAHSSRSLVINGDLRRKFKSLADRLGKKTATIQSQHLKLKHNQKQIILMRIQIYAEGAQ